ncbi:MAG: hypothetical protein GY768_12870 [Planctomycetaceae bacterium]|nr:hypothetical protein [Planctomycetaceae bacterium]
MAAGAPRHKPKKAHSSRTVANETMDADFDMFEASDGDDAEVECAENQEDAFERKGSQPLQQDSKGGPRHEVSGIGARVLMKVLYAARLARFDLLRAIGRLATYLLVGMKCVIVVCTV